MKTKSFYLGLFLIVFSINTLNTQNRNPTACLSSLPNELELKKSLIRSYQMTTDYIDFNLKGDFVEKKRLTGKISINP